MKHNVVLIGFMGTGKSSTGRALASRLGCAFVDLDQKIEQECGMRIPEIFETHGEDFFRAKEAEAVKEAAGRRGIVISTGGGTVKNPQNMEILRQHGIVISLVARSEVILSRTRRKGKRPVLDRMDQGDRKQAIEKLMEERRALYEKADYVVDTSEWSPFQVVEDICRYLKMRGAMHA